MEPAEAEATGASQPLLYLQVHYARQRAAAWRTATHQERAREAKRSPSSLGACPRPWRPIGDTAAVIMAPADRRWLSFLAGNHAAQHHPYGTYHAAMRGWEEGDRSTTAQG